MSEDITRRLIEAAGNAHHPNDRFSRTPGAMLGESQYNRVRLQEWIESNAARFLVEHRGAMR